MALLMEVICVFKCCHFIVQKHDLQGWLRKISWAEIETQLWLDPEGLNVQPKNWYMVVKMQINYKKSSSVGFGTYFWILAIQLQLWRETWGAGCSLWPSVLDRCLYVIPLFVYLQDCSRCKFPCCIFIIDLIHNRFTENAGPLYENMVWAMPICHLHQLQSVLCMFSQVLGFYFSISAWVFLIFLFLNRDDCSNHQLWWKCKILVLGNKQSDHLWSFAFEHKIGTAAGKSTLSWTLGYVLIWFAEKEKYYAIRLCYFCLNITKLNRTELNLFVV